MKLPGVLMLRRAHRRTVNPLHQKHCWFDSSHTHQPSPCRAQCPALTGGCELPFAGLFYNLPASASQPRTVFCRSSARVSLIRPLARTCAASTFI